jgi:hypothetical protein
LDGKYLIDVPVGKNKLQVSYIGYSTVSVDVSSRSTVNITLFEEAINMQEVVVVGYNTVKRSQLTGAVLLVLPEMLLLVWAVTELETMVVQALLQQAHFMQPVVQVVLAGLADRPLPVLLARSGLVLPQQLQVSLSFTARAVWV